MKFIENQKLAQNLCSYKLDLFCLSQRIIIIEYWNRLSSEIANSPNLHIIINTQLDNMYNHN